MATEANDWSVSAALRFVVRDGKRILQQRWVKSTLRKGNTYELEPPFDREYDWRDVPEVSDGN